MRAASIAVGIAALVVASFPHRPAAPLSAAPIQAGPNDISGIVTSPTGPEAGVWVIAQTSDLPTKFAKIVVTDDRGRYLIPELPKGTYDVWVRGYGLVDSPKRRATPGTTLDLRAVRVPTPTRRQQANPARSATH